MKTSIFVPISIVVLCLAALGVLVWQAITPPPLTASNQITVTPNTPTSTPVSTSSSTLAPENPAMSLPGSAASTTLVDAPAGKDASVGAGTSTSTGNYVDVACKVDGCSGQLCEDASAPAGMTTCEMKPEYTCYRQKGARCEVQKTGKIMGHCGWTQTEALAACLSTSKGSATQ